jgi:hypothetical protein
MSTYIPPIPARPIQTLSYKTYFKRLVVQALRDGFQNHPDPTVSGTTVGLDYSMTTRETFPLVIVKFYERDINDIGVGHVEYLLAPNSSSEYIKYYHRLYHGDVEFEIFALRSLDRDTIADAFIEVAGMWDTTPGGQAFWNRLYVDNAAYYAPWHYVFLNTGVINGFGEMQQIAPWLVEDVLVYQTSYRIPALGEFYSNTPSDASTGQMVSEVDLYMWTPQDPEDTDPSTYPGGIIPYDDYLHFVAPISGQTDI